MRAEHSIISKKEAFSLIELLCVMAVIFILASLLLPALNQARARAKKVGCVNNLRQVGMAFHNFAHDHNGHFPMAVPGSAGGSQEFTLTSYQTPGEFFFSFRHFQILSNDLVSTKMLVCPADTRLPASNFGLLQNADVSYFVGLKSDYSLPNSILAGDGNLTNDYVKSSTLVRLNRGWRWTSELHQFKGNLLFADAHVEEKSSQALAALDYTPLAELALPTLPRTAVPAMNSPSTSPAKSDGAAVNPGRSSLPSLNNDSSEPQKSSSHLNQTNSPGSAAIALQMPSSASAVQMQITTNAKTETWPTRVGNGPADKSGSDQDPGFSLFPPWFSEMVLALLKKGLWWLYLLLLLIVGAALFVRMRASSQKKPSSRKNGEDKI